MLVFLLFFGTSINILYMPQLYWVFFYRQGVIYTTANSAYEDSHYFTYFIKQIASRMGKKSDKVAKRLAALYKDQKEQKTVKNYWSILPV